MSKALDKIFIEGASCCNEECYRLFVSFCVNTLYEEMLDKKEPSEELNLALDYIKYLDKFEAYKYQVGSTERHKLLNMIKRHNSESKGNKTLNKLRIF